MSAPTKPRSLRPKNQPPSTALQAFKISERRKKVAEMYLSGMQQIEIAEALREDKGTVCRDLAAVNGWLREGAEQALWQKTQRDVRRHERRIGILEQDRLKAEEGWERSKLDEVFTSQQQETQVAPPDAAGQQAKVPGAILARVEKRGQAGDPRFLKVIVEIEAEITKHQAEISKLQGTYAPVRQAGGVAQPLLPAPPLRYIEIVVGGDGDGQQPGA